MTRLGRLESNARLAGRCFYPDRSTHETGNLSHVPVARVGFPVPHLLADATLAPMASMVAIAPSATSFSSSSGMAVISLAFSATFTWPRHHTLAHREGGDDMDGRSSI